MKRIVAYRAAIFVLSTILSVQGWTTDLYRSIAPNGDEKYASQMLDASYVLYRRDVPGDGYETSANIARRDRPQWQLARVDTLIDSLARKYQVDAALVRAIMEVESGFDPNALSHRGARGLMQLMPATAARYGVTNRADVAQNIEAGIRYLKDLLALHNGNIALALASYNAGEGAVAKHGKRIPPFRETMLYVPAVLARREAARKMNSQ
jgi:soluble lytic murein transglycosylase-like protein